MQKYLSDFAFLMSKCLSERKEKVKGFFVSLGDLFEKHGAAQTGTLTKHRHAQRAGVIFSIDWVA